MANVNITFKPDEPQNGSITYCPGNYILQPNLSLTGNPIQYTLSSEVFGGGAAARLTIQQAVPGISIGSTLTLNGIVFTADPTPGYRRFLPGLPPYSPKLSLQSLADAINQDTAFKDIYYAYYFEPSPGTDLLIIQAKQPGSTFNITATLFGPSWVINLNQTGVDRNRGEKLQKYSYGFWMDVWIHGNDIQSTQIIPFSTVSSSLNLPLGPIVQLRLPWNNSNEVTFDISPFLNPFTEVKLFEDNTALSSLFQSVFLTDPINNWLKFWPSGVRSYYCTYGEEFNNGYDPINDLPANYPDDPTNFNIKKYAIGQTDIQWAIDGTVNELEYNFTQNYWDHRLGVVKPLTRQPSYKLVRRQIESTTFKSYFPELLGLMIFLPTSCPFGNDTYKLEMQIIPRFIDGTSTAASSIILSNSISVSGIYTFRTEPLIVKIDNIEQTNNKRVLSYFVQLNIINNSNLVSKTIMRQEYKIDDRLPDLDSKHLIFKNSLGLFDTFTFVGDEELNENNNSIEYQRSKKLGSLLSDSFNPSNKLRSIYKKTTQLKKKSWSGWIDQEHYLWLKDLINSTTVYVLENYGLPVTSPGGWSYSNEQQLVAKSILITDSNFIYSTDTDLFNLEITWEYTHLNNNIKD